MPGPLTVGAGGAQLSVAVTEAVLGAGTWLAQEADVLLGQVMDGGVTSAAAVTVAEVLTVVVQVPLLTVTV